MSSSHLTSPPRSIYLLLDLRTKCGNNPPFPTLPSFTPTLQALKESHWLSWLTITSPSSSPSLSRWSVVEVNDQGSRWMAHSGENPKTFGKSLLRVAPDPFLSGLLLIHEEERSRRPVEKPPTPVTLSPSSPPPLTLPPALLFLTPHLHEAEFVKHQAAFITTLSKLASLDCSLHLIDILHSPPSSHPSSTSAWCNLIEEQPFVQSVIRTRWTEPEEWLSLIMSLQPMQASHGKLIVGEADSEERDRVEESITGLLDGSEEDVPWLAAAQRGVGELLKAGDNAWQCPVLLMNAVKPRPEPVHVQLCGCHAVLVQPHSDIEAYCSVSGARLSSSNFHSAVGLPPWFDKSIRSTAPIPTSSTLPFTRCLLTAVRRLKLSNPHYHPIRDTHGTALRITPDVRGEQEDRPFIKLIQSLREENETLLIHMSDDSPSSPSSPITLTPTPVQPCLFILLYEGQESRWAWLLPYVCAEQVVVSPSSSAGRGSVEKKAEFLAYFEQLSIEKQSYRPAMHSSNWLTAVQKIFQTADQTLELTPSTPPSSAPTSPNSHSSRPFLRQPNKPYSSSPSRSPSHAFSHNRSPSPLSASSYSSCSSCESVRRRGQRRKRGGRSQSFSPRRGRSSERRKPKRKQRSRSSSPTPPRRAAEKGKKGNRASHASQKAPRRINARNHRQPISEDEDDAATESENADRSSSSVGSHNARTHSKRPAAKKPKLTAKASKAKAKGKAQAKGKTQLKVKVKGKRHQSEGEDEKDELNFMEKESAGFIEDVKRIQPRQEGQPRRSTRVKAAQERVQENLARCEEEMREKDEALAEIRRQILAERQKQEIRRRQREDGEEGMPPLEQKLSL